MYINDITFITLCDVTRLSYSNPEKYPFLFLAVLVPSPNRTVM